MASSTTRSCRKRRSASRHFRCRRGDGVQETRLFRGHRRAAAARRLSPQDDAGRRPGSHSQESPEKRATSAVPENLRAPLHSRIGSRGRNPGRDGRPSRRDRGFRAAKEPGRSTPNRPRAAGRSSLRPVADHLAHLPVPLPGGCAVGRRARPRRRAGGARRGGRKAVGALAQRSSAIGGAGQSGDRFGFGPGGVAALGIDHGRLGRRRRFSGKRVAGAGRRPAGPDQPGGTLRPGERAGTRRPPRHPPGLGDETALDRAGVQRRRRRGARRAALAPPAPGRGFGRSAGGDRDRRLVHGTRGGTRAGRGPAAVRFRIRSVARIPDAAHYAVPAFRAAPARPRGRGAGPSVLLRVAP